MTRTRASLATRAFVASKCGARIASKVTSGLEKKRYAPSSSADVSAFGRLALGSLPTASRIVSSRFVSRASGKLSAATSAAIRLASSRGVTRRLGSRRETDVKDGLHRQLPSYFLAATFRSARVEA